MARATLRALAAALVAAAPLAQAAGDAAKGAAIFASDCAECHSAKEGKDKKGPTMFEVVGRTAGQKEGFIFSDALKASGLVWNAETLSGYLAGPKKFVPGGKMKYDGLDSATARDDLIAYLATLVK